MVPGTPGSPNILSSERLSLRSASCRQAKAGGALEPRYLRSRYPQAAALSSTGRRMPSMHRTSSSISTGNRAEQLIGEAFRVLASGGIVRIIVPDLHAIVREYLGDRPFGELSSSAKALSPGDLLNERLLMRWPSPLKGNFLLRIYEAWQDFHSHKWMYDEHSLSTLAPRCGFCRCRSQKLRREPNPKHYRRRRAFSHSEWRWRLSRRP